MKIITRKNIRAYRQDANGKLIPAGGFIGNRIIAVNEADAKRFPNAEWKALPVVAQERIFILANPDNYLAVSDNFNDCGCSEFGEKIIATPERKREFQDDIELYYGSDARTWNDWELTDYLTDDVYYSDDGDPCTPAKMAKMSRKQRKKCKKAARVEKKQTENDERTANTEQTRALTETIKSGASGGTSSPNIAALLKDTPASSGTTQAESGFSMPVLLMGGAFVIGITVVVIMFVRSRQAAAAPIKAAA